jgi:hypothetical protein
MYDLQVQEKRLYGGDSMSFKYWSITWPDATLDVHDERNINQQSTRLAVSEVPMGYMRKGAAQFPSNKQRYVSYFEFRAMFGEHVSVVDHGEPKTRHIEDEKTLLGRHKVLLQP